MRYLFHRANLLLLALLCLFIIAACGDQTPVQVRKTPTPLSTPSVATTDRGQQVLTQMAQLLNSARTLHGVFRTTISGSVASGDLVSEVWNAAPGKSRTLVQQSTISQYVSGSLVVSNGKQIWQYDPSLKVVYTGSVSSSAAGSNPLLPGKGSNSNSQQAILGLLQSIFGQSNATLLSSNQTVAGQPIYLLHISPNAQQQSSSGVTFSYDGTVSVNQQTHLPVALDLNIQGLGRVQMTIPTLTLNQPLAASLFTFTPPPGIKVLPLAAANPPTSGGSLTLQQAEQQAGYHLLSIPSSQTAYQLKSLDALGAPGNQIYTFTYVVNGQTVTLAQGKPLANLPVSGQSVSVRGTTAHVLTSGNSTTLSWTEKGVGLQLTSQLIEEQLAKIATLLT